MTTATKAKPAVKAAPKAMEPTRMADNIQLEKVTLDDIYIDEFQRPVDERWLKGRVDHLDLAMLGTLILSDRERDGKRYSAIDGQHRIQLAMRNGMTEWFAIVFTDLSIEEEAMLFSRYQAERRNITPYQRFNAKLVAKDPSAMAVKRIVEEEGFTLGPNEGGGYIKAVIAVEKIYEEDPAMLRLVLQLIRDSWGDLPFAQNERMIKGVWMFVRAEPDLDFDRFVDRLKNVTPQVVASRADQLRQARGTSTAMPKLVAEVIEMVYRSRTGRKTRATA